MLKTRSTRTCPSEGNGGEVCLNEWSTSLMSMESVLTSFQCFVKAPCSSSASSDLPQMDFVEISDAFELLVENRELYTISRGWFSGGLLLSYDSMYASFAFRMRLETFLIIASLYLFLSPWQNAFCLALICALIFEVIHGLSEGYIRIVFSGIASSSIVKIVLLNT